MEITRDSKADTESVMRRQPPVPKGRRRRILGSRWTAAIFILVIALTVRMLHISEAVQGPLMRDTLPMYDSQYYDKVAREVAEGDILGDEVFYLAPLYPYTMAIPYRLFRTRTADGGYVYNITTVRYLQCALGAVSCVLAYWVGSLAMGRWAGVLTGLMAAVYGVFVYYDGIIMPSSLVLFLHLLALLVLLLAARYGSAAWWVIGGVVLGLCAVAHGTALLVLVGVLLWVWKGFAETNVRTKLVRVMLILAGFVPIIAVVTVRNYVVGKDFVPLTSNAGKNLYIGNNPTATGSYGSYVFDLWGSHLAYYMQDVKRTPNDVRPSQMSQILARGAVKFILEHPLQEVRLLAKKFRLFFTAVEVGINDHFYFARRYSSVLRWSLLSFGVIGPIGLTGLFYSLKRWREHLLLLVFIASQIISFTIVFVLGRYRLVFVVCLMPFVATQLAWWWSRLRQRQYHQVAVSLVPLVLFASWIHYPVEGFTESRGLGQQYAKIGESYQRWGEIEKARESFEMAVQANFEPWGNPYVQRAMCYIELGGIYERMHNWSEAIEAYEKALFNIGLQPYVRPEIKLETVPQLKAQLQVLRQKMATGPKNGDSP